jgi:hypothetical protein
MKAGQSENVEFVGYSDMGGRPDSLQVVGQKMGSKQYLYVGHLYSDGVTILDVSDPAKPNVIGFKPSPNPYTKNIKVQVADNLMIVPCEAYLVPPKPGPYTAGIEIWNVSDPYTPQKLSFFKSEGLGVHRSWYDGGRYGYFSNGVDHVKGAISHGVEGITRELLTLDLSNPVEPKPVSRYYLPGQLREDPGSRWKPGDTYYVHEPTATGKRAYVAYWDLGFAILDMSDPAHPEVVSKYCDYPEKSGGCTHTVMALPDRNLLVKVDECTARNCYEVPKHIWLFDIKDETHPTPISTLPTPKPPADSPYKTFCEKGDRFGPHCIHENRNGSKTSSDTIYATYCNAGLRIYDISDPYKPREKGYFVPPDPQKIVDPRPYDRMVDIVHGGIRAICTQDVYVDDRGYIYITDTNAGLYILKETR